VSKFNTVSLPLGGILPAGNKQASCIQVLTKMSAKELMILVELATSMGYTGDELKQFVAEVRKNLRQYRERARKRMQGRLLHIGLKDGANAPWKK